MCAPSKTLSPIPINALNVSIKQKSSSLLPQNIKRRSPVTGISSSQYETDSVTSRSTQRSSSDLSLELSNLNLSGCMKVRTQCESLAQSYLRRTTTVEEQPCRKVCFSDVEFRMHCVMLGDNPSVSSGLPLTIEWKPFEIGTVSVDELEKERSNRKSRTQIEMQVSSSRREQLICSNESRVTRSEMIRVQLEINEIRRSRRAAMTPSLHARFMKFAKKIRSSK